MHITHIFCIKLTFEALASQLFHILFDAPIWQIASPLILYVEKAKQKCHEIYTILFLNITYGFDGTLLHTL